MKRAMMRRNNAMAGVGDGNRLAITNALNLNLICTSESEYSVEKSESDFHLNLNKSSNRNKKVPNKFKDMIHDLSNNGMKTKNMLNKDMVQSMENGVDSGEEGARIE
ncbi:hypothetical protein Tco_1499022 [Tanacetum coccineum]